MRKIDLKSGMVVIINGINYLCIISGSIESFVSGDGWMNWRDYNDDLTFKKENCHSDSNWDIMKVYKSDCHAGLDDILALKYAELIWEKGDKEKEIPATEMTITEIENELGYKVKIINK
jgi:hypothetical protein